MAGRVKIGIVGFTEHRNQTPFANSDWEIWPLNDLYFELPTIPFDRVRWFQLHAFRNNLVPLHDGSPTDFTQGPPNPRDPNHLLWLREMAKKMPVYLLHPQPEIPEARVFPMEEYRAYFQDGNGDPIQYLTNSISYMLALAIMELAPISNGKRAVDPEASIGVFGVDMMASGGPGSEYGWQRPSCEFFLGIAMGAGIKLYLPKESDLLKTAYPYGDEHGEYFRAKLQHSRNMMSKQRGEAFNAMEQAKLAHAELTGWINCCDYLMRSHMPGDPGEPGPGRVPLPDSHKPIAGGVTAIVEQGGQDGAG